MIKSILSLRLGTNILPLIISLAFASCASIKTKDEKEASEGCAAVEKIMVSERALLNKEMPDATLNLDSCVPLEGFSEDKVIINTRLKMTKPNGETVEQVIVGVVSKYSGVWKIVDLHPVYEFPITGTDAEKTKKVESGGPATYEL